MKEARAASANAAPIHDADLPGPRWRVRTWVICTPERQSVTLKACADACAEERQHSACPQYSRPGDQRHTGDDLQRRRRVLARWKRRAPPAIRGLEDECVRAGNDEEGDLQPPRRVAEVLRGLGDHEDDAGEQ